MSYSTVRISNNDIEQAFKKLLTYAHYDKSNTNLYLRERLSRISGSKDREELFSSVEAILNDHRKFRSIKNKITYYLLPKGVASNDYDDGELLTNNRISDTNEIERFNVFIDGPLEIYILSVLWLMEIGYHLDKNLSENCYGNRLILNKTEERIVNGKGLFKPYVRQYQRWRDDAVNKAKEHLENGSNVGFVNLDITSFYYHVRLDWDSIPVADDDELVRLHELNYQIHKTYTQIIRDHLTDYDLFSLEDMKSFRVDPQGDSSKPRVILPIGLPSSFTLANYYLKDFDKDVIKNVKPLHYGRYVDDIVIVLSKPKMSDEVQEISIEGSSDETIKQLKTLKSTKFLIGNLSSILKPKLSEREDSDSEKKPESGNSDKTDENSTDKDLTTKDIEFHLKTDGKELLYVQNQKVMIYEFEAEQSLAAIEKLKHDLQENNSEFRFLPEVDDFNFDANAYELLYDDSKGKPRTLKDYKENRYGLSTYLTKRTAVSVWIDRADIAEESKKILAFFKGSNTINFFQQWERLLTYLVINERYREIYEFISTCIEEIIKCKYVKDGKEDHISHRLQNYLLQSLFISFAQALTLDPTVFEEDGWLFDRVKNLVKSEVEKSDVFKDNLSTILTNDYQGKGLEGPLNYVTFVLKLIKKLRQIYFVRNHLMTHPLIEFTKFAQEEEQDGLSSLVNPGLSLRKLNYDSFSIPGVTRNEDGTYEGDFISPRHIKFYEVCLYLIFHKVLQEKQTQISNTEKFLPKSFLEEAFNLYAFLNNLHPSIWDEERKKYFQIRTRNQELKIDDSKQSGNSTLRKSIAEILLNEVEDDKVNDSLTIGLANMRIDWSNKTVESLKGQPVVNEKRFERITNVLNKFEEEDPKPDICVLPEFAIPHDLGLWVSTFAIQRNKATVFGMEHMSSGKNAYNFIVSCLPIYIKGKKDAVVLPRLKNHYAPEEEFKIKNYKQSAVKPAVQHYHLFHWRGVYFTNFYCYELANIEHRSWFRSKVDFMLAPEFNKDVNYFSNIVESTARDLNTFVVQVNTSNYGDSRITRPTKTILKDILNMKGGENDLAIMGSLDIKKFREFQRKGYGLQKENPVFKPTPPNFELEYVLKRIDNEWLFDEENSS